MDRRYFGVQMAASGDGERADDLRTLREENARLLGQLLELETRAGLLQILSDRAADAVVLHDGKGNVIDANRRAWESLGYTHEEYLQLNIRDLDPNVARIPEERFGKSWVAIEVGKTIVVDTVHLAKDGREVPMEILVTVFLDSEGERMYVAACRDATRRRAAEEAQARAEAERQKVLDQLESLVEERTGQLSRSNARLREEIVERQRIEEALGEAKRHAEEANRAKSQFLASMSHELRTPLNAVIGYAEMLQEDAEDEGLTAFIPDLEKIRGAGRHLLGIINDILDLSKVEAGKMDLSLEDANLGALVEDVISTIRPLAEGNKNQLHVDIRSELGRAYTDVTRVRQILFNLLSNACKFTEEGSVMVTAERVPRPTGSGEIVRFIVADDGIGISEEHLERLFTPFTQADASTTRKYGGTGLGLSISKRLCAMLGGSLEVHSAEGEGSAFTVTLPVRAPSQSSLPPAEHRESNPELPLVMVVDDDEDAQELICRTLEKEGYSVLRASSGPEALELARIHRPRVITLDVIMPSMDGWAVLAELKADPELRDVPVVLVTMVHDRRLGFSLGASDFLNKPVDRARLLRVLDRHRSEQPPCSVLVVDDDRKARELARRALEKDGWQVREAEDGNDALLQMRKERPGVVLLDLMMPGLDGFGVLTEMETDEVLCVVPVIVLTAAELSSAERSTLSQRASHVMYKGGRDTESLLTQVCERVAACVRR